MHGHTRRYLVTVALLVGVNGDVLGQSILRDTLTIGGVAYLRSQMCGADELSNGAGHAIEAFENRCVTIRTDATGRILLQKFGVALQIIGSPLDMGTMPPQNVASSIRWRGGYLWYPVYIDAALEMRVRRLDPDESGPPLEFPVLSSMFLDGRMGIDARDGILFAILCAWEADGDESGVFGRILTIDGAPLTPRTRLAVGPITPNLLGDPALLSEGALISFHREPPGVFFGGFSADSWNLLPWDFVGTERFGIVRALTDGNVATLLYSVGPPTYRFERRTFTGDTVGPRVPITAIGSETFRIAPDGRMLLISNGEDDRVRLRLRNAAWEPVDSPFLLAIGDVLPVQARIDGEYTSDGTIWVSWRATDEPGSHTDYCLTVITPVVAGDLNGDGRLDNFDIDPFVLALVDRPAYEMAFDGLPADSLGDFDGDGRLTNFDIDPFVAAQIGEP